MFVEAIDVVAKFTRPIHSIIRNYGSTLIQPGAATLFFVNDEGWALTCGHVAQLLAAGDKLLAKRQEFSKGLEALGGSNKRKHLVRDLERKFGYSKETTFELLNLFYGCLEGKLNAEIRVHKELDIALLHFSNYSRLLVDSFPYFAANGSNLKQGMFLCRLGFPFPEFSNFELDQITDSIRWTQTGRTSSPRFPIEGMVTRHLVGDKGQVVGFEMSTPGLRGQSGGPAFDSKGIIWGMQSRTGHLDLDFDVNQEVVRSGVKKHVSDSAFLHVGHCIHVDALKSFMRDNQVKFQEK